MLSLSLVQLSTQAQTKIIDYQGKNTYEIGGITIKGAATRDRNAIKSIANMHEGTKIQIPGPMVTKAIKDLLKLRLFEDVQIIQDSTVGDLVYLTLVLVERPILSKYSFKGVKSAQQEDLNDIVKNIIVKGSIVTDDQKELAKNKIKQFYINKGRLDAEVKINEFPEKTTNPAVRLEFVVNTKDRIRVETIVIDGNSAFSDRKIRRRMEKTKRKGTLFKKSKYIESDYREDLKSIVKFYQNQGYKNMTIIKDTHYRLPNGNMAVKIKVEEGNRHYFRNIKWKGNTIYKDDYLYTILGINSGDVYNPELLNNRLKFSLDGRDISSLYLDDGYLSFDVNPVEVAIENDSVDIEMRIFEGPQFTVENVVIKGNDRTNEHVIRREIRTRPGQKFSRSDIIRSQREITNLGYFDPEKIDIQTPVNSARGTVDIVYSVEEKPVDQLELSAGYGGFQGLIGTLGVVFNNFSVTNLKDRSTWSPLPQGDGQKLSIRLQSNSRFFKSYNASFTEPWLGGKKPRSFTIGAVQTAFDYSLTGLGKLKITRGFIGLGSQLKWPDDYFSTNTTLNIEQIDLDNFSSGGFSISKGKFNNFNLRQTITRSSVSDPLYPRRGSRISFAIQATLPYSLFRKNPDIVITQEEREQIILELEEEGGPGNPPTEATINAKINELRDSKRFGWLEYHKWKVSGEWYFNVWNKLVAASNIKVGILGAYNSKIGLSPFERFELGGDGINNQNQGLQGKEIISARGYDTSDILGNGTRTANGTFEGAPIYNKFTFELRYPLSLNPSSTIYVTSFVQGVNAYNSFKEFNPFDLKRSAGFGARVFLPMFGLLGFDYGWGFDKNPVDGKYGRFNIVLGFEPE